MFRAGLTGTNWTGKTETIRRFMEAKPEANVEAVSLSVFIDECPFPTVEQQTVEASAWVAARVREACQACTAPVQLFDRTPVDILAFTLYAEERSGRAAADVVREALGLLESFDVIFYIPVPDLWPVGVSPAPEDIEFARKMDGYIREAIDRFGLKVNPMPWDFDARHVLLCQTIPSVGKGVL